MNLGDLLVLYLLFYHLLTMKDFTLLKISEQEKPFYPRRT